MDRPDRLSALLYWAAERESVRLKREAGEPGPWTSDPILQEYRFCNVRRRDDRVSRWLLNVVLQPRYIKLHGLDSFLLFSALCRWINWPPTIQDLIMTNHWPKEQPDWAGIGKWIDHRFRSGEKTWTGAYMIRAKNLRDAAGMGKGGFVAEEVIGQSLVAALPAIKKELGRPKRSARAVWELLHAQPHWGPFMAGQVVADWTYLPQLLGKATDLYTWAPTGPGSVRGFNRVLRRPLDAPVNPEEWDAYLPAWRTILVEHLGPGYVDLTLHDIQNCLCELDKYLRVLRGEGKPRASYRPETAF